MDTGEDGGEQKTNKFQMLAYLNTQGKITIGKIDPNTKLQTRRIGFRKQVNKALMIKGEDLVLANVEEPDFGFLDPNRPDARNSLQLLSKSTFASLDTYQFDRYELANCIY